MAFSTQTLPYAVQTETLDTLAEARNYNQWILGAFAEHVRGRVLEVGCGTGNFTELLLERAEHLTAVDVHDPYVDIVRDKLSSLGLHHPGKTLEARCQNIFESIEGLGTYDTIVLLNVLEHLPDDHQAIATLRGLLRPGGRLILWVPALSALYSDYDRSIHHYRRYHRSTLRAAICGGGLSVERLRYYNFPGIFGWWLNFCLLKKTEMTPGAVRLFDVFSPLFRAAETWMPPPVGLSLLAIAKAPL